MERSACGMKGQCIPTAWEEVCISISVTAGTVQDQQKSHQGPNNTHVSLRDAVWNG